MKKVLLLLIVALGSGSLFGQTVELIPYYGYQLGGSFYYYNSAGRYSDKAKVKDNPNYGVALNVSINDETTIELMWNRMDSNTDMYLENNFTKDRIDVVSEYYTIGAVRNFKTGRIVPYAGGSLGVAVFTFKKDARVEKATRFAGSIQGGAKIFLSDRVGIRLQARMLIPMYFAGVGLSCGVGTGGAGCGGGAGFGSEILQGDFTGGLVIKLKSDGE